MAIGPGNVLLANGDIIPVLDLSFDRERGQYGGCPDGLAIRFYHNDEELNEIFVYDQDVPVFLEALCGALTPEQRGLLGNILDVGEVAP